MSSRSPRRPARSLVLGLLTVLLVAGCMSDSGGGSQGGADDLPGPVPRGVSFRDPRADAVPAPDFTAELLDGTSVTASDLWADRPLVLLFTASWCGMCADLHREVAGTVAEHDGAIALLGVVGEDDVGGAREYAEELDLDHPVVVTSDAVWLGYAAREPPLVVLVAPGGNVVRGWPGSFDVDVFADALDGLYEDSGDSDR